jgi:fructose-bisphosphate aldolase class II
MDGGSLSMPLVPLTEMLREAQRSHYAVGYFESWNLESTRLVIEAAEEERSPVIIGFNGEKISYFGHNQDLEYYSAIGKVAAENASVPTVLLLNEASDYSQVIRGLRCGFTCVMLDGSSLPFEKNVEITRKIVGAAHSMGACVEGQIDVMPEAEQGLFPGKICEDYLTRPEKAAQFVDETGVDALAVSVGAIHGLYAQKAEIDLERIVSITKLTDVPLVLHGATGVLDKDIKKAVQSGICKINIGAALRLSFINGIRVGLENEFVSYPEEVLESAEEEMKELVKLKMRVYGCSGKGKVLS